MTRDLNTLEDMVQAGLAAPSPTMTQVSQAFRVRMTRNMRQADHPAVDAQFVPTEDEARIRPEELVDPIGDDAFRPTPALTHRYPDRVILHATQTCEVYCRFCFRREAVGQDGHLSAEDFEAALHYLRDTPQIREVILTGGDPMILSPRRLRQMLDALAAIPHIDVIRFHTRVPVVAPQKITDDLLDTLDIRPAVFVVVHTNHAAELTPEAEAALRRLVRSGTPLLSQTVLLRGVNDTVEALSDLFRALLRNRVKPYYLHHCDLARGTSHFRTTIAEGQALMRGLRGHMSGIALPTYVLDLPGGHGKMPIGPGYVERADAGVYRITDYRGVIHDYRDPG
ncbi:lysine-2,3-aminomutase-like protein [Falsirhodobacter halotolerans]|uniref:lysine-2,3-aminomutase-like protein n=1 Tax=Falsirhodobacter halotolerans TaxID=1146892 RepID=UPI001FD033A1|nr:lysine-2,3-aminomutase-like protein [Falsirhodobacter halotolerans]MCJ8139093.1 lysine-2,3-aminomutase-like protein [Falsirhodobacter halotolerans]